MAKLDTSYKKFAWVFRGRPWLLIFGFLLFVSSLFVAGSRQILPAEETILRAIYNLPDFLLPVFLLITLFGSIWTLFFAIVVNYLTRHRQEIYQLVLGGGLAYFLSGIFKFIVDRPRPYLIISGIHSREFVKTYGSGFPSTHSAVAMAIAIILVGELSGKWRFVPIILAIMVGISRIYLGVHLPLDVIGGWGIGLMVGSLVTSFKQQKRA